MILRLGSKGEEVKNLQKMINIQSDGVFGKGTENAVKKFQHENGLVVDGIVGPVTLQRIKNKFEKVIKPVIIRLGSKGEEVAKLQESLNLISDGIFDRGTENAVKEFQHNNGLVNDGIVGPVTWSKLGFTLLKDSIGKKEESNYFTTDNGLVIHKHYLSDDEYMKGSKPEYIFLHHTAGWYNPYKTIDHWDRDNRGAVATEFVLGGQSVKADEFKYDGELVKCFPQGGWGWHLGTGRNHVHKNSVGIEVNNFGYVTEGGYHGSVNGRRTWIKKESDKFYTWAGVEIHPSQMIELDKPFRGHKYWHKYSKKQIETLKKWLYYIGERDSIDITKGLPELIKQKGPDAFEYISDVRYGKVKGGVWSHTTVRKDKVDMFPQPDLLEMLISL